MVRIDAATAVSRRRVLRNAATLAIGVAAPSVLRVGAAFAAYPDRVIKIVVPNTPGPLPPHFQFFPASAARALLLFFPHHCFAPEQRHSRFRRCPVCDGADQDARGIRHRRFSLHPEME